jgi:hypothetical protein
MTIMAISKALKRDKKSQLMQGIKTHFGKQKTVTLKGKAIKLSSLLVQLQASIDAGVDTDSKRVDYLEAAETSRQADATVDPIVVVLTDYLQSTLSATDLADFGLKPKTRAVPDVATKAAAIKQSAATREARGTMSKKAKSKIFGVVNQGAGAAQAASASAAANGGTKPSPGAASS